MHVAITGASGLIGSALVAELQKQGHSTLSIGRSATGPNTLRWDPANGELDAEALEGVDAVVHLAGEGIATNKWSDEQKRRMLDSRVDGTDLIATTIAAMNTKPKVLVSGSAIGYYGDRGTEVLTEASTGGSDFLADLCSQWEAATQPAEDAGIRVAHIRTGIVLSTEGGALERMLPFFKLGIGGKIGNGKQMMSWVSVTDMVGAIIHIIETDSISGPANVTGPAPVSNNDFTKALGAVLGRPTLLPTPTPALYLMLGKELAQALLFTSADVRPATLTESGYDFAHPTIDDALRAVLK